MSAVTASILVGTRNRVDVGVQPRWIVLLHEANGYAWHLLRLQLSSGDLVAPPKRGLPDPGAPGTRPNLDVPPGILWRGAPDGDLVGELALMLHLHAARTGEILTSVRHLQPLALRRVDLAALSPAQTGDLRNAVRVARASGGGLYLAVTILAGSRLTRDDLFALPDWELNVAETAITREWVRLDGGHLEITDYRDGGPIAPEDDDPYADDLGADVTPGEAVAGSGPSTPGEPHRQGWRLAAQAGGRPAAGPPASGATGPGAAGPDVPGAEEHGGRRRAPNWLRRLTGPAADAEAPLSPQAPSSPQALLSPQAPSSPQAPPSPPGPPAPPAADAAVAWPPGADDARAPRSPVPTGPGVAAGHEGAEQDAGAGPGAGLAPAPEGRPPEDEDPGVDVPAVPPLTEAEREQARRFGIRRTGPSVTRARLSKRERDLGERRPQIIDDGTLDSPANPGDGNWLDDFLRD